jgi:hypothetical protein
MKRLVQSGSPMMRELLRAGRLEMPSPSLTARACRALGVGTGIVGVVASSGTAHAAGGVGIAMLVKWTGVGLIVGVGALAVAGQLVPTEPQPVVATPPQPTPQPVAAAVTRAPVAPPPAAPLGARTEPARRAPAAPSAAAPEPASTLAAEARLLEQARAALRTGDASQAQQALGQYDREFPGGELASEAAYLRMEVLTRQGDRPAAAAAARRLLHDHPESPQTSRARSVAGDPEP